MKILWLKTELLHPVDKGGKIRTYQMLKHLRRQHYITYLTLCDPATDTPSAYLDAEEYCHHLAAIPHIARKKFSPAFYCELGLNLGSPLPYAIQRYRSARMQEAIKNALLKVDYDVVVCDFLTPSINMPERLSVPTVLFQHNVEAIIWARHYQNSTNKLKKAFFFNQWRKMQNYERQVCQRFDAVVAVSDVDRDLMRQEFGLDRVYDVPTGVDTQYFAPAPAEANPFELVFTGSMDWMPNEDAILYFAEQVLPKVAATIPEVKLTVVGRNPGAKLAALAAADSRITITGRVDDVRPFINRAAAYVVPIRVGGGTRLKIYEAMAMAKPVISTTIGAEGLAVRNGEELLIADEPQSFARAVISVLQERAFAEQLGRAAREVVCEQFSWQRAAAAFGQVCERVQKQALAAA
jgi:sugar transferase (PEP-CTERM/EpsH1 system associated)